METSSWGGGGGGKGVCGGPPPPLPAPSLPHTRCVFLGKCIVLVSFFLGPARHKFSTPLPEEICDDFSSYPSVKNFSLGVCDYGTSKTS